MPRARSPFHVVAHTAALPLGVLIPWVTSGASLACGYDGISSEGGLAVDDADETDGRSFMAELGTTSSDGAAADGSLPSPIRELKANPRTQKAEPPTDTDVSCPAGLTKVIKNDRPNLVIAAPNECIVALGRNDTITDNVSGNGAILAGSGADLVTASGPSLIAGGAGGDTLTASGAGLEIYG